MTDIGRGLTKVMMDEAQTLFGFPTCWFNVLRPSEVWWAGYTKVFHWLARYNGGLPMEMLMGSGLLVQVIGRSCVLEWFGVRPWAYIQDKIRLTSCWRCDTSAAELTDLYRRMSSAYRINLAFCERGRLEMEFIWILNRSGPKMDPCGTPEVTGVGWDTGQLAAAFQSSSHTARAAVGQIFQCQQGM